MQNKKSLIRCKASIYLLIPLLLLCFPVKWFAAVAASAVLHELCHMAMLRALRKEVCGVEIGVGGMEIRTEPMAAWQELLCALAGPASCLLTLPIARWFPRLAVCSVFHSLYNLLPIYPLDGGRALLSLAEMLLPLPVADRLCRYVEVAVILGIAGAGIYGTVILHLGLLPVLFAALLLVKAQKKSLQR